MVPITGDTYEIRDQLKALGCRWDEAGQCWSAPNEGERAEGQALADGEPWRKWRAFCETLTWAQGSFKKSTFEAALNGRSRGIPMEEAKRYLLSHIMAAGAKPPFAWIDRDVSRAYEKAEPPKEKHARAARATKHWPQTWREEMKWVGSVCVGVKRVEGFPVAGDAYCSRFALKFFGLRQGHEVSEAQWEEIKRLDAHLLRLRAEAEKDAPAKPEKPEFEEGKLAAFASTWRKAVDALWLCDRSPIDPTATPDGFLRCLYLPGERVIVLDVFQSQGQWLWSHDQGFEPSLVNFSEWDSQDGEHKAAPPTRVGKTFAATGPAGVWYLCNPVDGAFRPIAEQDKWGRPKWSRRWEGCVTTWRYFALESDDADPREWMGAIVQLPLPIAAIYTSGGGPTTTNPRKKNSIHVLVRVDAGSKAQFDLWRETAKRVMIPLGADPQCMSAVRLTRLPGCRRELDKDGNPWPQGPGWQRLLFLDPTPTNVPLIDRPTVRDTMGAWERLVSAVMARPFAEEEGEGVDVPGIVRSLGQLRCERARALIEELRRWMGC